MKLDNSSGKICSLYRLLNKNFIFRFVNSVTTAEPFDEKSVWKNVKKVRSSSHSSYEQNCSTWLNKEDVSSNLQDLYDRLEVFNVSNKAHNISLDNLNTAAEMFVYLNICPKDEEREEWKAIYNELIKKSNSVSGLLTSLFRIMKRFPGDGNVLAQAMLKKIEKRGVKKKLTSDNIPGLSFFFLHFIVHCSLF